ncbi:hypothetical protein EAD89_09305 [Micromonospora sp. BL4]|uniref:hypothetical protein n=1 Tax=Micromonospora sp. BL4 TaxID=2478710 RepID=UPI000EF600D6|nr:hypothetical protein [Micromonospora sp. BL4]RLP92170.1 hypothetical protein EAD89_09305 [Micromonospora sp. BL4]
MRARRLVAVASVAVGLVALSGCRAEPGIAAYVGDHRITDDRVAAVLKDLRDKNPKPTASPTASPTTAGQPAPPEPQLPGAVQVTSVLVLSEVCERISAEKNYQPRGQVPREQVAEVLGLEPGTGYVREMADLYTCLSGVPSEPVAPTAQEMATLIGVGREAGQIPANMTDEDAARQLDGEQLRGALATRRSLVEAAEGYDVTVSPRYRPLEFPVLSFPGDVPAVSVPLGELGSDAVTDISTPEPVGSTATPEAEGTAS